MEFMTEDATVVCAHEQGVVSNAPSQSLVTVAGRRVLVEADPEGRPIRGCPNIGATIKPCLKTLKVKAGYSTFVRIEGHSVSLVTVTGLTDGTPPGVVIYKVRHPGQDIVQADA